MKVMTVRFNAYQGDWLKAQAKFQDIHCADYLRALIEKQMQEPHFFEYFKAAEDKVLMPLTEKPYLIYNLMAYKLVEQLVLNQENGQQKREAAYRDMLEWLERLKIYDQKKKSYRLSLLLYPEHLEWLNQQSKIFKKRVAVILRKIVCLASMNAAQKMSSFVNSRDLTEAQQEELKATLMTFTLLKTYIISDYEEGEKLVKSCYESAHTIYSKLYPIREKSSITASFIY